MAIDDSTAEERLEAFGQAIADTFVPVTFSMDDVGAFCGRVRSVSLCPVQLSDVVVSNDMTFRRTYKPIRQNAPEYLTVGVQLRGRCLVAQDGREAKLAPGDYMVYDTTRPYEVGVSGPFEMYAFMIPHSLLRLSRAQLSQLTVRSFSGQFGLGTVVSPFLVQLGRRYAGGYIGNIHLADALVDMLAASFAEQLGGERAAGLDAGRGALMLRVRTFIEQHLGDPRLDVATIAAAHHISVRYLQKCFKEDGHTITGWIRARRIEHCRRDLANVALADLPVGSIGAHWGLANAAYLSRLFRQTHGMSPSEYRALALS